ncbi:hypothetical protein C9374_005872 [Naegleria lovaniensis]|uniref:Uncharacterized protein n=1 Tax=Naegleria lovaniensis TaxID=51637 RepID=A0AA88GQ83_NAELO|nr:uncharacterized protein C9374_005872 [Naegleria lovaniensis]KAG2382080.1 hypothetical protein C9374_005872 [Naegleria lovaniensis]
MGGGASKNSFRQYLEEREHPFQKRTDRAFVVSASKYRAHPSQSSETTTTQQDFSPHDVAVIEKGKIISQTESASSSNHRSSPPLQHDPSSKNSPRRTNTLPVKQTPKFFKQSLPYSSEPLFSWFKKKQRPNKTFPSAAINEKDVIVDEASVWHNTRIWVSNPDETETSVVDGATLNLTPTLSSSSLDSNEEQTNGIHFNNNNSLNQQVNSNRVQHAPPTEMTTSPTNIVSSSYTSTSNAPVTVVKSEKTEPSSTNNSPPSCKNANNTKQLDHNTIAGDKERTFNLTPMKSQRTKRNVSAAAPLERNRSSSLPNAFFPIPNKRTLL